MSREDPDRARERLEVAREEEMLRRERQDRVEDYTPAPSSLPPRVLLKQRHNRERLEMLRRHEAEQRELHDADCPRPSHGGPCKGPLRFELAETALEVYERHIEAIEAVLLTRLHDRHLELNVERAAWIREFAEELFAAADVGI